MRNAVFILAALQVSLLIFFAASSGASGSAGAAMSQSFITLAGIVIGILMAPALILAITQKALGVALTLSIVSAGVVGFGLASV